MSKPDLSVDEKTYFDYLTSARNDDVLALEHAMKLKNNIGRFKTHPLHKSLAMVLFEKIYTMNNSSITERVITKCLQGLAQTITNWVFCGDKEYAKYFFTLMYQHCKEPRRHPTFEQFETDILNAYEESARSICLNTMLQLSLPDSFGYECAVCASEYNREFFTSKIETIRNDTVKQGVAILAPCQHWVCSACLLSQLEAGLATRMDSSLFKCPHCRTEIVVARVLRIEGDDYIEELI